MTQPHSIRPSRQRSRWCVAMAALWLGCSLLLTPVSGAVLSASIDPDKYGDLDQDNVPVIGGCACGPTSVVNSLVYLQGEFPEIYGEKTLVPYLGTEPTQVEMAAVATILGSAPYMDAADGATIEDFIFGKTKYLEEKAPGKTRYNAQVNFPWRSGDPPNPNVDWPDHPTPKPDWVQDNTAPTLDFIYRQIRDGEDVEIFVALGGDHYLTVTGIEYDDQTNMGELSYIDPLDGMPDSSDIVGLMMIGTKDFIELDYELTPGTNMVIAHAVSESPVPEPAAIALLAIGLVGLGAFRRRASFASHNQSSVTMQ